MIKWFGKSWGAPLCKDTEQVETPIGQRCDVCEQKIVFDDQGVMVSGPDGFVPHHIDCFVDRVVGPTLAPGI